MHELAIAESIINTVLGEAERKNFGFIKKIVVKIGALTDIAPDALQFGFEAASADTKLDGTALEIRSVPLSGKCNICGKVFVVEEYVFECPACGSSDIEMTQGDELDIEYIEVEENPD